MEDLKTIVKISDCRGLYVLPISSVSYGRYTIKTYGESFVMYDGSEKIMEYKYRWYLR